MANYKPFLNYSPEGLDIDFTDICTAECNFCGRNQSYYSSELSVEEIKGVLDQCQGVGIHQVLFGGGEVTLRFDGLVECIGYASSLGLEPNLVSNSQYAKSLDIALEKSRSLRKAGLKFIGLSLDEQHQESIPYDNVLNAAKAAIAVGMHPTIKSTYIKSNMKENASLIDRLAHDMGGSYHPRGNGRRFAYMTYQNGLIPISVVELCAKGAGRAKDLPKSEILMKSRIRDIDNSCKCDRIGIKSNGDITTCPGFHGNEEMFSVGNINNKTLNESLSKANDDSISNFMHSPYSFAKLNRMLLESKDDNLNRIPRKLFDGTCQYCTEIFSNEDIRQRIISQLQEFRGAMPEFVFSGKETGTIWNTKVRAKGEEFDFIKYYGPVAKKDFFKSFLNYNIDFLKDSKKKISQLLVKEWQEELNNVNKWDDPCY